MGHSILVLSAAEVSEALPMADAIEAMRRAFAALATGEATLPPRTVFPAPRNEGTALLMPAFLDAGRQMGVKLVALFPPNPERGLPLLHGLMVLLDGATGRPMALLEGSALTAIRTGAASGLATDLLARTDARKAAILGAGIQGATQLEAVCAVRPVEQARVFDPLGDRAQELANRMGERLGLEVSIAASATEALAGADVVCTATTSAVPVFDDADLPAGAHVNAIGAFTPQTREVPEATVLRARVVVDHRPAAMEEAGDLLIPLRQGRITEAHIQAELGEIVAGRAPGRGGDDEVTLFKSVGVAVQDVAAAWAAVEGAEATGLGQRVAL
ncbi:MAG: ornithine cyclodeaminase family protein [Candidatus Brocadiia bacterium]